MYFWGLWRRLEAVLRRVWRNTRDLNEMTALDMILHAHKISFTLLVEIFVEIFPVGVLVALALCIAVEGGAPALFGTLDGRALDGFLCGLVFGPLALGGFDGLVFGLCLVIVDVCALNVGDFPSAGGEVCAAVESLVVELVGETGGLFVWEDCML